MDNIVIELLRKWQKDVDDLNIRMQEILSKAPITYEEKIQCAVLLGAITAKKDFIIDLSETIRGYHVYRI